MSYHDDEVCVAISVSDANRKPHRGWNNVGGGTILSLCVRFEGVIKASTCSACFYHHRTLEWRPSPRHLGSVDIVSKSPPPMHVSKVVCVEQSQARTRPATEALW
jgi:hypothetical protein